jgi:voltage-dependent calcium channel alpha-2/delta-3
MPTVLIHTAVNVNQDEIQVGSRVIKKFLFSVADDYNPDPTERYDVPASKSKEQEFDKRVLINRTRPERCDKVIKLFHLSRPKEKEKSAFDFPMSSSCDRPFIALPIPSSNMILVVASAICSREHHAPFIHQPVEKHYNASSLQCYKLKNFPSYRRQLKHCFNKHQNESQIELCGKAPRIFTSFYILSLSIAFYLLT